MPQISGHVGMRPTVILLCREEETLNALGLWCYPKPVAQPAGEGEGEMRFLPRTANPLECVRNGAAPCGRFGATRTPRILHCV